MATSIEDVLSAVCSRVESVPSHNVQKIFMLGNEKEAKIACDILISHGFGAKLYHENGNSRMYLAQPAADMDVDLALSSALSYANMLKTIQNSLEQLHQDNPDAPDYSISMNNLSDHDKTISIHLTTPARMEISSQSISQATSVAAAAIKSPAKPKSVPQKAGNQKKSASYDKFMTGPQITTESWLARHTKPTQRPDSLSRRIKLYVFGNAASAGYVIAVIFITFLFIYSLFVLSKSYFCADFVKAEKDKNRSWYCSAGL